MSGLFRFLPGDPEWGERYTKKMAGEFALIEPHLPNIDTLLDIGCGLAGLTTLIARRTGPRIIYLVDGDGTGEKRLGYNEKSTPWDDVQKGVDFVEANYPFALVLPNPDLRHRKVGFIMSTQSGGHHYPVREYINVALNNPTAPVLMDIRNPSDGRQAMEAYGYKVAATIETAPKHTRYLFVAQQKTQNAG